LDLVAEISQGLYRAGSGEPLLLLHGFTGTWHHWRPVLAELVARYEVIAPTLAGHDGGPPYPISNPMSFPAATDSLERHLDELGVDTAHVVGNSMGGALAIELAKRSRARSVVALAPAGGWNEGDGETPRLAKFFARQIRMTRALAPRMDKVAATVLRRPMARRLALRDMMRRGELVAAGDVADITRAAARCEVADKAVAALRADDREFMLGDLDRISCPVLLASPQFDRILPAELHAPRLRREIPGVESRTLSGYGHVPMWDDTRLVVQTITEFVDRHAGSATPAAAQRAAAAVPPADELAAAQPAAIS
jgi:pimeloyl-ACP methyl ester carboxylesterase